MDSGLATASRPGMTTAKARQQIRLSVPAACSARALLFSFPLVWKRGRGKAGRRLAPANRGQEMHTGGREAAGSARPSRAMVWTAPRALPGERGVVAAVTFGLPGASKALLNRCVTHNTWRQTRRRQTERHALPRPFRKDRLSLESVLTFEAACETFYSSLARPVTGPRLRLNPPPALACHSCAGAVRVHRSSHRGSWRLAIRPSHRV